ncbi:transmembrane reductase CYB561D2-like [Saccoglossus kowalevskii]|uniref:ascorbate ferrireductase (transmembrane) n=1 Tax=Saccoglossus kowalevskii TaxID=10224 RepID=A0ABM0GVJ8_SACKO|nr:PREDICTED: cytochrome b561 domain-containing protein 2-like [Saccoglossus kowalevskii]
MADEKTEVRLSSAKNTHNSVLISFSAFLGMVAHLVAIVFCGTIIYHAWPGSSLFSWHPTLMSVAFAFLVLEAIMFFSPESTLLPKAMRKTKVRYHWINNVTGLVCALAGVITIVSNKYMNNKPHFTTWHGLLGIITVGYCAMQCIAGSFMLYPKMISQYVKLSDLKLYHATSGVMMFTLACGTMVLGIFSNWFVSQASDTVFYMCLFCPGILALVVTNQVTQAYLPKAFKKRSQQI